MRSGISGIGSGRLTFVVYLQAFPFQAFPQLSYVGYLSPHPSYYPKYSCKPLYDFQTTPGCWYQRSPTPPLIQSLSKHLPGGSTKVHPSVDIVLILSKLVFSIATMYYVSTEEIPRRTINSKNYIDKGFDKERTFDFVRVSFLSYIIPLAFQKLNKSGNI